MSFFKSHNSSGCFGFRIFGLEYALKSFREYVMKISMKYLSKSSALIIWSFKIMWFWLSILVVRTYFSPLMKKNDSSYPTIPENLIFLSLSIFSIFSSFLDKYSSDFIDSWYCTVCLGILTPCLFSINSAFFS